MTNADNTDFSRQRNEALNKAIELAEKNIGTAAPSVVLHIEEKSPDSLRANAEKDVWSLFSAAIRHLKDGAPDGQPGSMPEAISRASLRSSPFAAALGIKPPHFEPVYFSIDYTSGRDAAIFLCLKLMEAAEEDFPKSRQIIQQKILSEKPPMDHMKEQMALTFNILTETYIQACREMKSALPGL